MHTGIVKFLITGTAIVLYAAGMASAQLSTVTYFDAGKTNVSDEAMLKSAVVAGYELGKFSLSAGGQFDLAGPSAKYFTGFFMNSGYEFSIKQFPLGVQGLFILNPYSDIIHEWSMGALFSLEKQHFTWKLGTGFRKYFIARDAREEFEINDATALYEKWNLMYQLAYTLKPRDFKWNAGIAITNIDFFLMNQETNPMINIHGSWRFSTTATLFLESWYKSAGTFNISANSFGYFFRTGLLWKFV